MKFRLFRIFALALGVAAVVSACRKKDDSTTAAKSQGRYIWWTSESMNGYYSAFLVNNSRIHQDPYTHSADGVTWATDGSDDLWRQYEKFGGYYLAEAKNENPGAFEGEGRIYTPLSGTGSIKVDHSLSATGISNLAWEGGTTVYAIANNAGHIYGGTAYDDYVLKSTNGGATWSPLTYQPPQDTDRLSFSDIWLIDGRLFVSELLYVSGGFMKYKLFMTTDGGMSSNWPESSVLSYPVSLHGVPGVGGLDIYASDENGTYKIELMGTTFLFKDLEFEAGGNFKGTVVGLASVNGGNTQQVFANEFGLYIIDPVTKKFYNPSQEGEHALPGVSGMVVFGDQLVVTTGSNVYKTPYPFEFHKDPE